MNAGRKMWNVAWRIIVCAVLLAWIFHAIFSNEAQLAAKEQGIDWRALSKPEQWKLAWKLGPTELWHTLASVKPLAFGLSLGFVGLIIILGVLRWRMALEVQGLHLPIGRALEISLVAHFFNSFLLGSSGGDLMKAYYAARETHHKKAEAVTTVFVDRLLGLWSMLFFAAVMMLPNRALLWEHERLGATALLILALLGGCTLVLMLAFWGGVSRFMPASRGWFRRLPKVEVI